ncbi:ABC-type multidrug transport system fused ATPase/permease subunit [Neomicrococcus aestuarii]|uniref:ABC-type multidrug transport system fused ATPase/permease subunit n=1 Tax=Neomicrococcus aestuarii TaxID=556325 RepID=A0A7W8TTA9_9MICC|nr:ABC transporter ATP-binding protein [Neomicrococcus aestuarii]MBB5512393.1 ABC-type multidrug transport system fused ATPase/permease subunit [Neomicrococcus aestuarii]
MSENPQLPRLLAGERRRTFAALLAVAFAGAACAIIAALTVGQLVSGHTGSGRLAGNVGALAGFISVLAGSVLGVGITKYLERVLAERLGQSYVHEIRVLLLRAALGGGRTPSLGITIARSTNDLSSIRNWVSQGLVPLIAAVPLVLATIALLWALSWPLGVTVLVLMLILCAILAYLAKPALERARELRRLRGNLAARISDTIRASEGIRAAGGTDREIRNLDRSGARVMGAAIDRARVAGSLRGFSMTTPLLGSAVIAGLGATGAIDVATISTALMLLGFVSAPVSELGRVVEYRQNFNAARRIIGPAIAPVLAEASEPKVELLDNLEAATALAAWDVDDSEGGRVVIRGLRVEGTRVPPLYAEEGERILVNASTQGRIDELFSTLSAPLSPQLSGSDQPVWSLAVDGKELNGASGKERRRRTGYAASGVPLERGTIARAVRYRRPDMSARRTTEALASVGLLERVRALPDGENTQLRRGGLPLDRSEVALLHVARASLGNPAMLLLKNIDSDLTEAGRDVLREILRDYPGVVIFASTRPGDVLESWRSWNVDAPAQVAVTV